MERDSGVDLEKGWVVYRAQHGCGTSPTKNVRPFSAHVPDKVLAVADEVIE